MFAIRDSNRAKFFAIFSMLFLETLRKYNKDESIFFKEKKTYGKLL